MYVSAFELYRIGPGPSSTYTGAPQRAALRFVHELAADGLLPSVQRLDVELYGGLAFHGHEHASQAAIVAGLTGELPERCDAAALARRHAHVAAHGMVTLGGRHRVRFDPERDLRCVVNASLAFEGNAEGNAVRLVARDVLGEIVASRLYFSAGGGRVVADDEAPPLQARRVPYGFASAAALVDVCRIHGKRIHDVARANECSLASPGEVRAFLAHVAQTMLAAVGRGLVAQGALPGGGPRTAAAAHAATDADAAPAQRCTVFATAMAEENAGGGTVVTAPSAGAAGPVAALLHQWHESRPYKAEERASDFLLAAAAVGGLLRQAGVVQVGCQGEVGVGAAMAAAGYAAVHNASNAQILFAAERALEPHLGLACDLTHGRIEGPCIERGARAAARAHVAASEALRVPAPRVGLDMLARSLVESGRAMTTRSKRASIGGVAVNIVEC